MPVKEYRLGFKINLQLHAEKKVEEDNKKVEDVKDDKEILPKTEITPEQRAIIEEEVRVKLLADIKKEEKDKAEKEASEGLKAVLAQKEEKIKELENASEDYKTLLKKHNKLVEDHNGALDTMGIYVSTIEANKAEKEKLKAEKEFEQFRNVIDKKLTGKDSLKSIAEAYLESGKLTNMEDYKILIEPLEAKFAIATENENTIKSFGRDSRIDYNRETSSSASSAGNANERISEERRASIDKRLGRKTVRKI